MRIRDLDEGALDAFKQGFNKGLGKTAFKPAKRETPLARLDPRELKKVLKTILSSEPLDQYQMDYLRSVYRQL